MHGVAKSGRSCAALLPARERASCGGALGGTRGGGEAKSKEEEKAPDAAVGHS